MMATYANSTDVSVERSRAELERTLGRYGATAFGYLTEHGRAVVLFEANDRRVRFDLPMPDRRDRTFTHTPERGYERSRQQAEQAWEQACRQRWRALNLVVKAKLEAIEAGIAEFEDEFAAYICLPNGTKVGDWLKPQIAKAYESNTMPALMPGGN